VHDGWVIQVGIHELSYKISSGMGGHREKSVKDKEVMKRVVVLEKKW
jgi:hypothetical protein